VRAWYALGGRRVGEKGDRNRMRIAVIGDLHVFDPASHGLTPGTARPPADVGAAGDADRYHTFTERVLPSLLAEVAATRPDLVVHTGDLAETGNREPAGSRELQTGLSLLRGIGAPLLLCRGNHDGRQAWQDICGGFSPARWDGDGVHLFTLDYPGLAPRDQFTRLERELDTDCNRPGGADGHLFLVAHAPAYALARPFFTDRAYAEALAALAVRYPLEAIFCGHTHNQAWSLHPLAGGGRWLQVKGVAVGFPGLPAQPLAAVRAICVPSGGKLLWGYLEDGAPGWNELVLEGERAVLRWHRLGAGVQAEARWRRPGDLEMVRRPEQAGLPTGPLTADGRVRAARLHLAGYGGGEGRRVRLNGEDIGVLPALGSFAPRQSLGLPPGLVCAQNQVAIETSPGDRLLIGALAIEAALDDGRTLRTPVDPWLHASSGDWDEWGEPRLRRVRAGEPFTTPLSFEDPKRTA
jgi:hypothetical protein